MKMIKFPPAHSNYQHFRVIRFKKYIQQEDIQKEAMVPSREAKQLTYRLMEENFVKVQVIRKANVSTTGPANLYSLFYINLDQVNNANVLVL